MIARPDRARSSGGFTLVEVLVGAMVLGIFISFVYGAVVSAFKVRRAVQSSTRGMASGTRAIDIIARDLENAYWRPIDDADAFRLEEDADDRSAVTFITTTDSRSQQEFDQDLLRSGLTEVGYRTKEVDGGLALFRREDWGVDDRPLEGGDWYKVVSGVREFVIEVFEDDPSRENGDEDDEAKKEWDLKEEKRLPRSARIRLVVEAPSTDPGAEDELVRFTFERWILFPGADDVEPEGDGEGEGDGN